jgi:hypothetical protein
MRQMRGFCWIAGFLTISVISACDGGKGPLAPTGPGGAPVTAPAAIQGTIRNSAASSAHISSSLRTAGGAIGMTVTVVGTNVGAVANAEGQFTLTGVRPGPVQLQFTGAGVDALLDLGSVSAGETVNIVVAVDGTTAVLEAESSDADPSADADEADDDDSDEADDQEDDDDSEDDDSDDAEDDDEADDNEDDDQGEDEDDDR